MHNLGRFERSVRRREAISYRQVVTELARILGKDMDEFEEDREDEDE